jgi:hypothetical protein
MKARVTAGDSGGFVETVRKALELAERQGAKVNLMEVPFSSLGRDSRKMDGLRKSLDMTAIINFKEVDS